jgi:uncharacterized protein YicC (UPF0701 family)
MSATTTGSETPSGKTEKAPVDYLQDALHDLDQAREKAGEDVSARIDSARDRINDAREDMSDRGRDQITDWRDQLERAADDALVELGRWAIRAQRRPEALTELSTEISKREESLTT